MANFTKRPDPGSHRRSQHSLDDHQPTSIRRPATPTLAIVPDIAAIYRAPRTTADKWRIRGWLGHPAAHASDTDIYVWEIACDDILAEQLNRTGRPSGRQPKPRQPAPEALAALRTRATVSPGVVLAGIAEIAYCLWVEPKRLRASVQGRAARGREMPDPIAVLGPALKSDGTPARQVAVWDLRAFADWPQFDRRGRGAELLKRNEIA